MKADEMHYFSYLFDEVFYMFRTGTLSIIRNISTLYTCNRYLSCCGRLWAFASMVLTTTLYRRNRYWSC